jgi:hypothetical protein
MHEPFDITAQRRVSAESGSADETRLPDRWIPLARLVCGIVAVLTLTIFVASLPVYLAQLQITCVGVSCASGQLTPQAARELLNLGLSMSSYSLLSAIFIVASALVWFGVAIIIIWRKSDDRMGLLVALMLILQGANVLTGNVGGGQSIWLYPSEVVNYLAFVLLFLVFCLFPNGKFVPRWMKWLAIGWIGLSLINFLPVVASFWLQLSYVFLFYGFLGSGVMAQIYRYRYVSNALQRQQTKWIIYGVATVFLLELGLFLFYLIFPSFIEQNVVFSLFSATVGNSIPVLIPLSFSMAILRHHLWDIDVIINRTVVYGLLTALLAMVYVGCVIALQSLALVFKEQLSHNPVTIVASTLVSAALFQPLRFRIQKIIDRRFYRRKYNTARTLTAFSATLRNEVDVDQLQEQVLAVVEETMQPTHVSLWLRTPEQFRDRNTRLLPRIDE